MGSEDTGELTDVLIYDHRNSFQSDRTVVRAAHGRLKRSTNGDYLVLELEDGRVYDEQNAGRNGKGGHQPLLRGRFQRDELRLDLSSLDPNAPTISLATTAYYGPALHRRQKARQTTRTEATC
jgi:lipopolysaccharide export system permease protein